MPAGKTQRASPPVLQVSIGPESDGAGTFKFNQAFRIGRIGECEVIIQDEFVSRVHADVKFENGAWRVQDLQSSNGIYVDGGRVETAQVDRALTIRLGIAGLS